MDRFLRQPLMVVLLSFGALAMTVPMLHAVVTGEYRIAGAFLYAALLVLVVTAMIALALANFRPRNIARSHLLQLTAAFAVLPLVLAIPMTEAVPGLGYLDAWFEMVSSFTTTGATVFLNPGEVPDTVHLWRALVGWIGGYFVLLAALSILAPMQLGGFEVTASDAALRNPQPSRQIMRIADPSERMQRFAGQLLPVYGGLTLLLWLGLILSGDPALVGLCHAMSTLSTSGISPVGGVGAAPSGRLGEAMVLGFLLFALSRHLLPGMSGRTGWRDLTRDPEVRLGIGLVLAVCAGLLVLHGMQTLGQGNPPGTVGTAQALWGGLFTTFSFLTTTGFVSADWHGTTTWAGLRVPGMLLVGLALTGGGIATTAGGVKLLRLYALARHGARELDRMLHPSAIAGSGPVARNLRQHGAHAAWVFLMLFFLSIIVVMLALALAGTDFDDALVLAVASLSTTGPLAGIGGATPIRYADLNDAAKAILAGAMVLGRLETLALIALFTPDGWQV